MTMAQIQFTKHQIEQLEENRVQTGASRTGLVRRAACYYIRGTLEHEVQRALLLKPASDSREAN